MWHVQEVSEKLMLCLARGLGFPDDYFIKAHDVKRPESQTVARLLHYFETPKQTNGEVWHRAGAHTDWDLLTLLFQKAGQSGLEVKPLLPPAEFSQYHEKPQIHAVDCTPKLNDLLLTSFALDLPRP